MYRISNIICRPAKIMRKQNKCFHSLIDISDEVKDSLNLQKPIVALESTIITHGMPYPDNVHTAIEVENVVRSEVTELIDNNILNDFSFVLICILHTTSYFVGATLPN